jgi:hypothetical protein
MEDAAKCGRGPIETGIPVFRDLEAEGTGKSGTETVVFCIDCVRRLSITLIFHYLFAMRDILLKSQKR